MKDSVKTNGAVRDFQSRAQSYLRGSVSVQKSPAKLRGSASGECSQCATATRRSEGACWPYSGGWRFGLTVARASALAAKRIGRSLPAFPGVPIRLERRATRVLRVVTWRKRSFMPTIEDPRCSLTRPRGARRTTGCHKAVPKSNLHAPVSATSRLRRAVWGCQLDRSSRPPRAGGERSFPRKSLRALLPGEQSTPAIQAAVGPERPLLVPTRTRVKQHSAAPAFTGCDRWAGACAQRRSSSLQNESWP